MRGVSEGITSVLSAFGIFKSWFTFDANPLYILNLEQSSQLLRILLITCNFSFTSLWGIQSSQQVASLAANATAATAAALPLPPPRCRQCSAAALPPLPTRCQHHHRAACRCHTATTLLPLPPRCCPGRRLRRRHASPSAATTLPPSCRRHRHCLCFYRRCCRCHRCHFRCRCRQQF